MAILNAGAMRRIGKDRYEMAMDAAAFLTVSWHGAHSGGQGARAGVHASLDVADSVANGQFDLYFCSTTCLRGFLNYIVDELESKIEIAAGKNDKRPERQQALRRGKTNRQPPTTRWSRRRNGSSRAAAHR